LIEQVLFIKTLNVDLLLEYTSVKIALLNIVSKVFGDVKIKK